MNKILKSVILIFTVVLFVSNAAYSAQKDVLLKTTSTWDKTEYKNLKIKNPKLLY